MRFSPFGWLNFVNIINKNLKTKQTILKEKTISLGLQKLWIFARRTEQNLPCIFSDTIKYMGCGACAYSQISDSKKPLHHRLLDKINTLKGKGHMGDMKSFISLQELKEIENATQPQRETIRLEELQRFQAGQTSLLSKQRRTAWKIAIYNQIKPGEMHPFSEHPTTNNQKTKNRFYEISLDVNRTFPLVKQLNRQHLTNVLQNITLNFQGIGYTQGMNFYTGFFLLCGFSKEEAYETFVRMSYNSHFLLIRNFSQNFKNVNCCVKIMDEVMKESKETVFYKIVDKIQSLGMNIFLFAFSWFLTYFLYNFNDKASILIWDYLLLFQPASKTGPNHPTSLKKQPSFGNGWVNSINLAIRILQSLSKQLLACNQISEMMNILRHDAIQAHLDEAKTEEIINKCRSEPLADMHLFREKCQQVDPQLLKIICDLQSPQSKSGEFVSFMNQCKVPKRSPEPAFQ